MRLAVCQMKPQPDALDTNRAAAVSAVQQAASDGAELIVLPELCITGYIFQNETTARAQGENLVENSPSLEAWTDVCRAENCYVVAGLLERDDQHSYNTAVLVGPQGLIGSYRKAHLFGPEKNWCQPGDTGFPVIDLPFGRVGLLICFDLRFPEAARSLTLRGAQMICVPTTWTDLDKPQPYDQLGRPMANYLAQVHAYTNRVFVACADRVGQEAGINYLGSSLIVGLHGQILAGPASHNQDETLYADIDLSQAIDKRLGDNNDLLADRRPELYQLDSLVEHEET